MPDVSKVPIPMRLRERADKEGKAAVTFAYYSDQLGGIVRMFTVVEDDTARAIYKTLTERD